VIDIPGVLDCTGAIDNLSGLIEFKRQLGEVVEIAVWMRSDHKRDLWFREPDLNCRCHRTARLRNYSISDLCHRSLVGFRPVQDLLLCAKHLFVAARTRWP